MLSRLFAAFWCVMLGTLGAQVCVPPVSSPTMQKAPIQRIIVRSEIPLPQDKLDKIEERAREATREMWSDEAMSSQAEEAAEMVRAAYQDLGYFKLEVTAKAVLVPTAAMYDFLIRVPKVGKQYRLRDLDVVHGMAFPEAELRAAFPIQRGDIFSRERIIKGLEELRRLYRSAGYVNFNLAPNTTFDDAYEAVDLQIYVDEGKPFRLRQVEILGATPEVEQRVRNDIEILPGEIYNSEAWERSFAKFHDLVQNPNPDAVDERLDEKNGWVDVMLDLRAPVLCHMTCNV